MIFLNSMSFPNLPLLLQIPNTKNAEHVTSDLLLNYFSLRLVGVLTQLLFMHLCF